MKNQKSRGSGRTTRIADQAIQDLFQKRKCFIKDHFENSVDNNILLSIIKNRLYSEHKGVNFEVISDPFGYWVKLDHNFTLRKEG